MNNPPYDPNNPYSQQTTPGQYPTFNQQPGQSSNSQWGQQPPPQFPTNPGQFSQSGQNFPQYPGQYPQPGQFGPPPLHPGQPAAVPPPLRPYGNIITVLLVLCCCIFIICLAIGNSAEPVGMSVIFGLLVSVLIMDWRGFRTLDEWINWKQIQGTKRALLVCVYVFFFMVIFFIFIYLYT